VGLQGSIKESNFRAKVALSYFHSMYSKLRKIALKMIHASEKGI